jgi:mRNA interferase RelE/StbE
MAYKISISSKAEKQLAKLPTQFYTKIIENILNLAENPRPSGCKKLKGRAGYRIRIGDYRVIYSIVDSILLVQVIAVGDRKEIYE